MRLNIHLLQWYILPKKTISVFNKETLYTFLCFTLVIENKK